MHQYLLKTPGQNILKEIYNKANAFTIPEVKYTYIKKNYILNFSPLMEESWNPQTFKIKLKLN